MTKHLIIPLHHIQSRAWAAIAVNDAPDGSVIKIRPPSLVGRREEDAAQLSFEWIEAAPAVPKGKPLCFDSEEDWQCWCQDSWAIDLPTDRYCRDCDPDRRDKMIGEKRCSYPETVFVMMRGEGMVGLRRDDAGWFGAITGKYQGSGKRAVTQAVVTADRAAFERKEIVGEPG